MSKTEIILIGAGGHAAACIDVIEQQDKFRIAGLIGQENELGQRVCGYSVFGVDRELPELIKKFPDNIIYSKIVPQMTSFSFNIKRYI